MRLVADTVLIWQMKQQQRSRGSRPAGYLKQYHALMHRWLLRAVFLQQL
jgi:hypothetical protein